MARRERIAAAVAMLVVGRASVDRIVVGIVWIGSPCGDSVVVRLVDAGALMIGVGLIGEGRGQERDRRERPLPRRQHVERQPVLAVIAGQMQRIGAAAQIVRHGPGEIRVPFAIAQIVGMEMDRTVVARRVAPALLAAGPTRTDHGSCRHVHQPAVACLRTDVLDILHVDAARKVPACQQVAGRASSAAPTSGQDATKPRQDCGILQLAGEMMLRRRGSLGREQHRSTRRQGERREPTPRLSPARRPAAAVRPACASPAGSTASHTRYQRAVCIAVPVAISIVLPRTLIRAVAPFAPIVSATPVSPASSDNNDCPASTSPGRTSTVHVQAVPVFRTGALPTMP